MVFFVKHISNNFILIPDPVAGHYPNQRQIPCATTLKDISRRRGGAEIFIHWIVQVYFLSR